MMHYMQMARLIRQLERRLSLTIFKELLRLHDIIATHFEVCAANALAQACRRALK